MYWFLSFSKWRVLAHSPWFYCIVFRYNHWLQCCTVIRLHRPMFDDVSLENSGTCGITKSRNSADQGIYLFLTWWNQSSEVSSKMMDIYYLASKACCEATQTAMYSYEAARWYGEAIRATLELHQLQRLELKKYRVIYQCGQLQCHPISHHTEDNDHKITELNYFIINRVILFSVSICSPRFCGLLSLQISTSLPLPHCHG
jgi:hypothetical protein